MIDICLLGCGGMMPIKDRRLTAMLFRYKGRMVLVDCGEGTQIPVRLAGWGFKAIDGVCFTHYHADHVAGLPGFLLTLGNSGRVEPLTLFGPPGLEEVVRGLTVIAPELPFEIRLVELPDSEASRNVIGEIIINSIPVEHGVTCLAYSLEVKRAGKFDVNRARENNIPMEFWKDLQRGETIEYQGEKYEASMVLGEPRRGLKVSYCTDSRPTEELINFTGNSDLLICEGMYGDEEMLPKAVEKKHMIFSEAATICRRGNSKELWLTHYSPALDAPELFIDNAKKIFENSYLGRDLMMKSFYFD